MIAAIEAGAIALAGMVLVAVPAVLLWWLEFDLAAEPSTIASGAASVWFLAHFQPIGFEIGVETALGLGLGAESMSFTISLAPIGISLLTVLLAFRSGWRFAHRGVSGAFGVLGGTVGFGVATALLALLLQPSLAVAGQGELQLGRISLWIVVGAVVLSFALPSALGYLWCSVAEKQPWWVRVRSRVVSAAGPVGAQLPGWFGSALRMYAAVTVGVIGIGAIAFVVAMLAGYTEIVTLSQALQLDILGLLLMFVLNLVLLPIAIVWSVAWMSGAGFAIGHGTSVTPFETLLGPVPALPLFGSIPQGWGAAAIFPPLMIVIVGVLIGALTGGKPEGRKQHWRAQLGQGVVAAALAGLTFTLLSTLTQGVYLRHRR